MRAIRAAATRTGRGFRASVATSIGSARGPPQPAERTSLAGGHVREGATPVNGAGLAREGPLASGSPRRLERTSPAIGTAVLVETRGIEGVRHAGLLTRQHTG